MDGRSSIIKRWNNKPGGGKCGAAKPIIELKNMSKTFYGKNGEVHALDGIDLTIYEGKFSESSG